MRTMFNALCLLAISLIACSGAQQNGGGTTPPNNGNVPSWTVGVQIGITVAQVVIPIAQATLDARADIPANVKADIDHGFGGSLPLLSAASTAITTYERAPTIENQCRIHYLVDQGLNLALDGVASARGFGAPVDPQLATALGSLGTIDDLLFPTCQASSSPAPSGLHMQSSLHGLARVRAVLSQ